MSIIPQKDTIVSEKELRVLLGPYWVIRKESNSIQRTIFTKDFISALTLANRIGKISEGMGHHPDILISWGKIVITLSTHSAQGVTQKDIALACSIDTLLAETL